MDETAVLNADKRKKAADAVCLVFDMLVLALVVWMALPALDAYTSAGIVRPGAVPRGFSKRTAPRTRTASSAR